MSGDEERTSVKTYVPEYQKETWKEHAGRLGMSQSEFIRTMVQAGRSDFDVPTLRDDAPGSPEAGSADGAPSRDDRDESIESRVRRALRREDVLDWDELVERVVGDLENDVDEALGTLQERNAIRYSGKDGGYVLVNDEG